MNVDHSCYSVTSTPLFTS